MGIFAAVVSKTREISNDSFVATMVRDVFEQMKETAVANNEKFPEMAAARMTEATLLSQRGEILDQAVKDGRREVRTRNIAVAIIETVRDIKLKELEFDGCVNPVDLLAIQSKAKGLAMRAKTTLMTSKGGNAVSPALLDKVEGDIMTFAVRGIPVSDRVGKMRAVQAAVWAVTELRLQQLV
jgi:hypothetical protein